MHLLEFIKGSGKDRQQPKVSRSVQFLVSGRQLNSPGHESQGSLVRKSASALAYLEMHRARLKSFGVEDVHGKIFDVNEPLTQINKGNVACSRYLFGGAVLNKQGNAVCGKGKCVLSTKFDDFYCSAIEAGGAALDRLGAAKCYGGCELESASMCESVKGQ